MDVGAGEDLPWDGGKGAGVNAAGDEGPDAGVDAAGGGGVAVDASLAAGVGGTAVDCGDATGPQAAASSARTDIVSGSTNDLETVLVIRTLLTKIITGMAQETASKVPVAYVSV